jgi:hypothetical protein
MNPRSARKPSPMSVPLRDQSYVRFSREYSISSACERLSERAGSLVSLNSSCAVSSSESVGRH